MLALGAEVTAAIADFNTLDGRAAGIARLFEAVGYLKLVMGGTLAAIGPVVVLDTCPLVLDSLREYPPNLLMQLLDLFRGQAVPRPHRVGADSK